MVTEGKVKAKGMLAEAKYSLAQISMEQGKIYVLFLYNSAIINFIKNYFCIKILTMR